tara:strand:- start:120 stop:953 length:834 start_codon:yes stop_codon:yes gene_type:complete
MKPSDLLTYADQLSALAIPKTVNDADLLYQLTHTDGGNLRKLGGRSVKTDKGNKKGVLTLPVYMSPHREGGKNMCAGASAGCIASCLGHSSGHLRFDMQRQARIAKTMFFQLYPDRFLEQYNKEIEAHARKAQRANMLAAFRGNGSTDTRWEKYGIPQAHPEKQFYDYTKHTAKARADRPENYHLTYSVSERANSLDMARDWLDSGANAAIVVAGQSSKVKDAKAAAARLIDSGYLGYPCIDGDETDIRFDDPAGHWVVLYAKGAALHDRTGFVHRF